MSWPYAYTPYIWPLLAAAALFTAIGRYAWTRREVPGGKPFLVMSGLSIVVMVGMALEAAAVAPATKLAWQQFEFVLLFAGVIPVTCLVLDYAYPGRWLTRRNLVLLFIPFLLCLLLIVIDNSRLIWRPLQVGADGKVTMQLAPAGAILAIYAVGMFALNAAIFLHVFIRSPLHRWPVALMFLGQVGARTAFVLDAADLPALSNFDMTALLVFLPWTAYAIALFGFRILEPLPFARQAAIEQMHSGLLVFDAGWRVANLNPAAETILSISEGAARGKTWQQLAFSAGPWPALPVSGADRGQPPDNDHEMTFGTDTRARHYAPALSELRDFRGLLMGYMLMLRDVTEERRAQAQVLEQQRALAALQERERLARELHDTLVQSTAAIRMEAELTDQLLTQGNLAQVHGNLKHLADGAQEMHLDLREYLFGVSPTAAAEQHFFAALRDYLARFSGRWIIETRLQVPAEIEQQGLGAAVETQLMRIVQEALANVRKHAQARQVEIVFECQGQQIRLTIQDDGCGFSVATLAAPGGRGFGTRSMRERAQAIGGTLTIESTPGQGTRVIVEIPKEKKDAGLDRGRS